ncbi:hypothetical protein FHU41_001352 [Psychromicrobium silvestre]|uniref:Uncharacterized protein n=1 Tax=Psychromicrobium silvestre TaxID=1645614 RepID=A0A7Y9LT70_9MICC|nr:hypothetical protein [Psychromicrobium silvestre]NYE95131.1 hypothetical protein [Psychromicrobium silvestre]
MTILGTWKLAISTPIGRIPVSVEFTELDGALQGSAHSRTEAVALRQINASLTPEGERVTWSQSITKPLRLNLEFDVTVSGDSLNGFSKAGKLPRSTVTGERLS